MKELKKTQWSKHPTLKNQKIQYCVNVYIIWSVYRFSATSTKISRAFFTEMGQFSSVQFSRSVVSDFLRPRESQHARPPCPSQTPRVHSDSLSIESVMPSSHLILGRPLLLLPPTPPSIRVFSKESTLRMRWPKYWSFSFNTSPSNEHPGLISLGKCKSKPHLLKWLLSKRQE